LWRNFVGKVQQNIRASLEHSGEYSSHPQNALAPKPMYIYRFSNKTGWCSDTKEAESHFEQLNLDLKLKT